MCKHFPKQSFLSVGAYQLILVVKVDRWKTVDHCGLEEYYDSSVTELNTIPLKCLYDISVITITTSTYKQQ